MTPNEHYYVMLVLPVLKEVARAHGYALTFHGSANRDLDLVAIPWVEEASAPEALLLALAESVNGIWHPTVTEKPHGRKGWVITWWHNCAPPTSGYPYIDVSVMPRGVKNAGAL